MHEDLKTDIADSAQFATAFVQALKAGVHTYTVTALDIEGLEDLDPPIDTSWMREENWDLGRLAPAA